MPEETSNLISIAQFSSDQELRVTYSVFSIYINMLVGIILVFVLSEVKVFLCTAPTRN